MKSVLISIQPKWCELIASGKKTVEVRKTKPKLETPFKCYIYRTKGFLRHLCGGEWWNMPVGGEVIGEFVCDIIANCLDINMDVTCLTVPEWLEYTKGHKGNVWGWHISDLVIYDKPKELSEIVVEGDCSCENCNECKWFEKGNGYNVENDCLLPYKYDFKSVKPLKRPPQSWCYVVEHTHTER